MEAKDSQSVTAPETLRKILLLYQELSDSGKLQSLVRSPKERRKDLDKAIARAAEMKVELQTKLK